MRANPEIRALIRESGLTINKVAEMMGFHRVYLSRLLSRPLTPDMRLKVLCAIEELLEERSG